MFNNVSSYVDTLCALNITSNQFLLCYLLETDEKVDGKFPSKGESIANLYKYAAHNKGHIKWSREEIKDLVDKGYLEDPYYKAERSYPDYLRVTDKYKDVVFASMKRFEQLDEVYPNTIENFNHPNGPRIKLKSCDKEEMKELYLKKVKTKALHEEIIELVRWAIENNQLNTSFENFIKGELWNTYRDLKSSYQETGNMHIAK